MDRRTTFLRPLAVSSRAALHLCSSAGKISSRNRQGRGMELEPDQMTALRSGSRQIRRIAALLRSINPAAQAAITRLSEIAGEEDRFLNGMAAAALEQSEEHQNGALRTGCCRRCP